MLDHQHRAPLRSLADQCDNAVDILMAHALGRLVQQHDLRLQGQGGGQLQGAFTAIGQFGGLAPGEVLQVHGFEQLHGALVERLEGA
ncbi:hypothetical protein D3C85_1375340 [compost metagenome]